MIKDTEFKLWVRYSIDSSHLAVKKVITILYYVRKSHAQ